MKDLELDRIGYEKMKENSEKKSKFVQNIMGSSSSQNRQNHSSILYKTNLSLDKCRREINMHDLSEDTNSVKNLEYRIASPKKSYKLQNENPKKEEELIEPIRLQTYESPEPSKSVKSDKSSCQKIIVQEAESLGEPSVKEVPFEDDNIETVKLDSSRLRSQKRGLPMDEKSASKEETPKGTNTQRRILKTEEN